MLIRATIPLLLLPLALGCDKPAATGPAPSAATSTPATGTQSPTPLPDLSSGPITFEGVSGQVTTFTQLGYTVRASGAQWEAGLGYGNPAPFILFQSPGGTTTVGEIEVTGGGAAFSFSSVDLYSSTTPIPYTITGSHRSAVVFSATGTVPNTFGKFRTVASPDPASRIDTLKIVLTNPAAPCCRNPVGLDNITLVK